MDTEESGQNFRPTVVKRSASSVSVAFAEATEGPNHNAG
jgi:hypothetical protein